MPGFHRVERGAETALLSVAQELAREGHGVTVAGGGPPRPDTAYRFVSVPVIPREKFERLPAVPLLRNETHWEDAIFAARLGRAVDPSSFDATLTCAYPFTNWALRHGARKSATAHVFVTQNGDWPAFTRTAEYRFFSCDGLVCTNPAYFERNTARWNCALIPNGIDLERFSPGPDVRARLGLPQDRAIVLMVSAFIDTKRVLDGIRAVGELDNAALVVAGDGPLRQEADDLAARLLPGRYHRLTIPAEQMPDLYRSADVFLHLSQWESFGNVFLEAAGCGLPVVAHASDLTRWILGDAPFLCDTSDRRELVGTLAEALQSSSGPPPDLQRFRWQAVAQQYAAFLQDTIVRRKFQANA